MNTVLPSYNMRTSNHVLAVVYIREFPKSLAVGQKAGHNLAYRLEQGSCQVTPMICVSLLMTGAGLEGSLKVIYLIKCPYLTMNHHAALLWLDCSVPFPPRRCKSK